MAVVAQGLRLWRERQERFPAFTRRPIPDAIDSASGLWVSVLADAGLTMETPEIAGRMRYERAWFTTAMAQAEPDALFVFGDNAKRAGSGPRSGQAIIRAEPNAIGIVVKHAPARAENAYYSDADMSRFRVENAPAFAVLALHLRLGGLVVWPADGIGTGRAELPTCAPRLWASLERARQRLEGLAAEVTRP